MVFLRKKLARLSALTRFRKDRGGSTAVEFAMVSLPFFGIIFAIIETGVVFLNTQVMESAVTGAGRLIMTGQVEKAGATPAAKLKLFKDELCRNIDTFLTCANVYYDVRAFTTFGDTDMTLPVRDGNLDTGSLPRFTPGNPGQVVVVRVYYPMKTYTSFFGAPLANMADGTRLIVGTMVFKNEPW